MGRGATGTPLPGLLALDSERPDLRDVFMAGDIHEEYEIDKDPIARGKFASVRLARHRASKEVYAAKFIRRRRRGTSLEDEARHEVAVLMLGRSAPHIVHLHQVYETRTEYIIILEFGAGGDLQRLLDDKGRFPENTVKEFLRQILKGLDFLHRKRIAHLDIKPQNLVMMGNSAEDDLKLVDFGLSRVIHEDTELTQIMGTPDYVAPEIINFEPVSMATDMWSIGVLTYVFLTGYTPFGADSDQETFVNITKGDYDFPDEYFADISESAKDFISCLLLKVPTQRMTVEECACHPWLSRLSQLSEIDSAADSGYCTDSFCGSPSSLDSINDGYGSDLYPCTIPEGRPLSTSEMQRSSLEQRSKRRPKATFVGKEKTSRVCSLSVRKPRNQSSAHLSIDVIERLHKGQRTHNRPLRQTSLIIPKCTNEYESVKNDLDHYNANQTFSSFYTSQYCELEKSTRSFHSHTYLYSGSDCCSWKTQCNARYIRNLNDSSVKVAPPTRNLRTNLGLHPELSFSMFELKPPCENLNSLPKPINRTPVFGVRKSRTELRLAQTQKECCRKQFYEITDSKHDPNRPELAHNGKVELADSQLISRYSSPKISIKLSHCEKSDSKPNNYNNYQTLNESRLNRKNIISLQPKNVAHLNVSLSHLDLKYVNSGNNSELEEIRDVIYSDLTLPRRLQKSKDSPVLKGNTFHMSFRRSKKKEGKV